MHIPYGCLKHYFKAAPAYEQYKDDLHYQASMFESSFGDGNIEGKKKGKAEERIELTKQMVLEMAKKELSIQTIIEITGLTKAKIQLILEKENGK